MLDRLIDDGAFSEREAAALVQDLCGPIALLHSQGYCHADIKPENLMLTDEGHVKLIDFGLSFEQGTRSEPIRVGTIAYWPPEMFDPRCSPTAAGDMWAFGVVLYMLLTARHPFDDKSDAKTERNIIRGPEMSKWPASDSSKRVVAALLRKDPRERLTIEQLLQTPWLTAAAPGTGQLIDPAMNVREAELAAFRLNSARLRAAVFAVMLRQRAAEGARTRADLRLHQAERSQRLRRNNSVRAGLLGPDLLTHAFHEFDLEGPLPIAPAIPRRPSPCARLASHGRTLHMCRQRLHL